MLEDRKCELSRRSNFLKRLAADLLPREIVEREKFGFRAPGSPYLLCQRIEWIDDMLSHERIRRQGYFDPDRVDALRAGQLARAGDFNPHQETDFLTVVLRFDLLCDLFGLAPLS